MSGTAGWREVGLATGLALLSAAVVWLMVRVGAVDHPGARSSHSVPTPKGGGVGIVAAFLAGLLVLGVGATHARLGDMAFAGVVSASVGIAAVSYADDVLAWSFAPKLFAQAAAALLVVLAGVRVEALHLPWGTVALGVWGVPLTLGWLLVVTNAVNFIDGLNGLAAGSVMIAAMFLAVLAAGDAAGFVQVAAVALAAGIVGFLPFNFPNARIFMGDVGSQFIGFVLAVLGVAATRSGSGVSALLVPMMLAPVLLDVAFTLVRRAVAGERLTEAHRGHLYQVAHRAGVPAAVVTLTYWGMTAWGGVCALAFDAVGAGVKFLWLGLALLPFAAWGGWVARRGRSIGRW